MQFKDEYGVLALASLSFEKGEPIKAEGCFKKDFLPFKAWRNLIMLKYHRKRGFL